MVDGGFRSCVGPCAGYSTLNIQDYKNTPQTWAKQVFDAELYALYQAMKVFDDRYETGEDYAIMHAPVR